jgi:DNA helicase-2/ATP-dependent DNA helicase PcrA
MSEHNDLLGGLNAAQRQAVTTTQGPLLILAGPGSGKTRVLTHRIAYLVASRGVDPAHILAVTFTNRAAREMRERLLALVGANAACAMAIGTFHAICARTLRAEAAHLGEAGITSSFVILDASDQAGLIKQALKELRLDEKQYKPRRMQTIISLAKNNGLGPEQLAERAEEPDETVASQVYRVYQRLLRAINGVDFDDLLMLTERLWSGEAEVLARYQQRWHYLHVDEFQDCNGMQYQLVRLLAWGTEARHEGLGHLCVVGDDDQMIYTWRGASAHTVLRFERDFRGAAVILLEQNYRSTQTILDAALGVVRRNRLRKEKQLWTERGQGEKIAMYEASDEEAEGQFAALEISRLLAVGEIGHLSEVAVMYRTNAQSRVLEEQFLHANIPYRVVGSRKFYERKEIKDVLAYLRLLANPQDDYALERIINVPNRKIGPKTLDALREWAGSLSLPLLAAANQIDWHPTLGKAAKAAVVTFAQLMDGLSQEVDALSLPALLDRVVERSGLGAELRKPSEDKLDRWGNIEELRRVAEDYAEIGNTRDALELFLENVALIGGADTTTTGENGRLSEVSRDAVTFITLHAAKGLEYPVVFIIGLDEGSLPHARSFDKPEQLEEERRLAYVGITRAMRRLYLVRAARRAVFGDYRYTEPSRFLEDLPTALVARITATATGGQPQDVSPHARP